MFIDCGQVTSTWDKEPPVMRTSEELKKDAMRKEWEKLIARGCRRTEEDWTKNESQDC